MHQKNLIMTMNEGEWLLGINKIDCLILGATNIYTFPYLQIILVVFLKNKKN